MKIRHRQNDADLLDNTLCQVSGRFLLANGAPFAGRLVITPERGGTWQGVYYAAQPFVVTPESDGMVRMDLPPSSAVGAYTLTSRPPGISMTFSVPADAHAIDIQEAQQ